MSRRPVLSHFVPLLVVSTAANLWGGQSIPALSRSQTPNNQTATIGVSDPTPNIGQVVTFTIDDVSAVQRATWNFGGPGCSPYAAVMVCEPGIFGNCLSEAYAYSTDGPKDVQVTLRIDGIDFGPYSVDLAVNDIGSCPCTIPSPVWSASINPANVNPGQSVFFHAEAQSGGPADGVMWKIKEHGQVSQSSSASTFHLVFGDPGVFDVSFEAWNCAGADRHEFTLLVVPVPGLSFNAAVLHPQHTTPRSMTSFGTSLLVGTAEAPSGGGLFRGLPAGVWVPATTNGFGTPTNTAISSLVVFDGYVYAATENEAEGAEIWRSPTGDNWNRVISAGFGDPLNAEITALVVHNGDLFAAVRSTSGAEVWRTANGLDWSQVNVDGFGSSVNQAPGAMASFGGSIYASVANLWNAEVWRRVSGTTWDQVNTDGFGNNANESAPAMVVFDSHLYVGTANDNSGSEVWRSQDGTTWSQSSAGGFGDPFDNEVTSGLVAHNGTLFAGTYNFATGAEIWATTDGSAWHPWALGGFGDQYNWSARAAAVLGDDLFIATENPYGFQVWQLALPVPELFSDGFESGGTSTWSAVVGD